MTGLGRVGGALAIWCLASATGWAGDARHLRGTLVAIGDGVLTVEDEDEERYEVTLTPETGIYVIKPAKLADVRAGQFVGVTSIESQGQRIAVEVHVFADDLRGTGEGHYPWDLVSEPNTMTNATIAEIKEASPVERILRLTYKDGEGHGQNQGEQVVRVPDFAEVVSLERAPDRSVLEPGVPLFLFVQDAAPAPPVVQALAVGQGLKPPM
jgi:hypothetical protein